MFWGRVEVGKIYIYLGREDVVLVHPQNGFKSLILNWCIGGCWFTPALFGGPPQLQLPALEVSHNFS